MRSSACSRAIMRAMDNVAGVERICVNVATGRAAVDWNPDKVTLGDILQVVVAMGFRPLPLAGEAAALELRRERRIALQRIGVAGVGMTLTMMLVYCFHVLGVQHINAAVTQYLKMAGMLLTTAVLVYSGAPFFSAALRNLRRGTLGMDVPITFALTLAYGASAINMLRGEGAIYFDSVTLCVFLLLTGRFVEMTIRQHRLSATEAFAHSLPAQVARVGAGGVVEQIAPAEVMSGDLLAIPKGAVIPVDSLLIAGVDVLVDESLVTGESLPLAKHTGQLLLGGSVNVGQPIKVIARGRASDSKLAGIVGLLQRTQAERVSFARAEDRLAAWFTLATFALASCAALFWFFVEPARATPAALAVLVVACPCAVALATPAAVAAATVRLSRLGLLVTRSDALERLASVNEVVIDKTGTLTQGVPTVELRRIAQWQSRQDLLEIAAALESVSEHAIATALRPYRTTHRVISEATEFPGRGVEGKVDGVYWRIGARSFVAEIDKSDPLEREQWNDPGIGFVLGNALGIAASFALRDSLRLDAGHAVRKLRDMGLEVTIASGDQDSAVRAVSQELGVSAASSRLTPLQKLALVQQRQRDGARVLMVGDGINDGPVLAAASVSCAMAQGSAIAQAAADLVLLNESLGTLADAIRIAQRMRTVIRQNLTVALTCNLAGVPLAALGWIAPWAAALSMAGSSLLVILNAARLVRPAEKRSS